MNLTNRCPRCTHNNPRGANYCYFDGYALNAVTLDGPIDPGTQPFPQAFVFPSGSECANFDQLATLCQNDWDSAREVLPRGFLRCSSAAWGGQTWPRPPGRLLDFPTSIAVWINLSHVCLRGSWPRHACRWSRANQPWQIAGRTKRLLSATLEEPGGALAFWIGGRACPWLQPATAIPATS